MASAALPKGALWMQNVTYPAAWDRTLIDSLYVSEGVINGFGVTPNSGLEIDIAAGRAVIQGDEVANQGKYLVQSDAVVTLTLASVGADRTEYVYIAVNDTAEAGGRAGNNVTIETSETPPADSTLVVATLTLTAGTVTVTSGMIADSRTYADSLGTVATDKIEDDAVTGPKIADDSLDSNHYIAGSIDREHLGPDAKMVFADAAARDAALSGSLEAGLIAYTADTGDYWHYTGSAWELHVSRYKSYAPSIVSDGVNPTVPGTRTGYYNVQGGWTQGAGYISLNGTVSAGSGTYRLTLPHTPTLLIPSSSTPGSGMIVGQGVAAEAGWAGGTTAPFVLQLAQVSVAPHDEAIMVFPGGTTALPFTLQNGCSFSFQFSYLSSLG